jgi:hypothetical protein
MINLVSMVLAISCMGNMQMGTNGSTGGSCASSCGMNMSSNSQPMKMAGAKQMSQMAPAAGGSCGCGMSSCTGHDMPMNNATPKTQGHVMTPGMKM